jgi:hypothetical protein
VVLTSEVSAAAKTRLRAAVTELEALMQEVQSAGLKISGRFEEITGRSPMDTSEGESCRRHQLRCNTQYQPPL